MTTGVSVIPPVGTPDPLMPRPERLIPSSERAASMLPSRTSKKVPWPVGTARSRVSPALVAPAGAVPWPTVAWPVAEVPVGLTSDSVGVTEVGLAAVVVPSDQPSPLAITIGR